MGPGCLNKVFIHSFITERGIQTFDEIDLTIAAPDEGGVQVVRRSRKTNIYIPLRPSASFGRRPALVQTPVLTALWWTPIQHPRVSYVIDTVPPNYYCKWYVYDSKELWSSHVCHVQDAASDHAHMRQYRQQYIQSSASQTACHDWTLVEYVLQPLTVCSLWHRLWV